MVEDISAESNDLRNTDKKQSAREWQVLHGRAINAESGRLHFLWDTFWSTQMWRPTRRTSSFSEINCLSPGLRREVYRLHGNVYVTYILLAHDRKCSAHGRHTAPTTREIQRQQEIKRWPIDDVARLAGVDALHCGIWSRLCRWVWQKWSWKGQVAALRHTGAM
jgi:hypothetical protein